MREQEIMEGRTHIERQLLKDLIRKAFSLKRS